MRLYTCCQCRRRSPEKPAAICDYWIFESVCRKVHPLNLVSPRGKVHKAKVTYCASCAPNP